MNKLTIIGNMPVITTTAKKPILVGLIILGSIIFLSFMPISSWRTLSYGTDSYKTHTPFFAEQTVSQTLASNYPISGIAAIIVDYNKNNAVTDVKVTVTDTRTQQVLGEGIIPADKLRDDSFAATTFTPPLKTPSNTYTITLAAPLADKNNMLALRFSHNDSAPNHVRFQNNKQLSGTFAISIREQVPIWKLYANVLHLQGKTNKSGLTAIAIAVAFASISTMWAKNKPAHKTTVGFTIFMVIMLSAVICSRFLILPGIGGASGGDPYNYLFIAQSMLEGNNPFAGEKRLPGFPALLMPGLLNQNYDDVAGMRIISIISAAAGLYMIGLLARVLGLPLIIQISAPALVAWQKDFFWTSLRPEPYTFYFFLMAAALTLFYTARKPWQQIVYGLTLGYAAMTRQEGFMAALILGICSLGMWRTYTNDASIQSAFNKKTVAAYARLYLPALLLVAPYFLSNTLAYGNPFFTPYFEGDRLQIVNSYGAFTDSLGATWGVIGSLWRPTWDENERYSFTSPLFLGTVVISLLWQAWWFFSPAKHTKVSLYTWLISSLIAFIGLTLLYHVQSRLFFSWLPEMVAALILTSVSATIIHLRWRALPLLAFALSQLLIVTWFHPFVKHMQHILPLISLSLTLSILLPTTTLTQDKQTFRLSTVTLFALCLAALLPFTLLTAKPLVDINIMVDKQNANSALDSVTYRAVKFALGQPGPYGSDQGYLPARLYFGSDGHYFYGDKSTPETDYAWVNMHRIRTLVTTNEDRSFSTPHPSWQEIARFKSEGRNERLFESIVYNIPVQ